MEFPVSVEVVYIKLWDEEMKTKKQKKRILWSRRVNKMEFHDIN